jgi:hypothetical protein
MLGELAGGLRSFLRYLLVAYVWCLPRPNRIEAVT